MAKNKTARMKLGRVTGLVALTLAATSLAAPTMAAAQDQAPRGGEGNWRGGGAGRGGEWRGGGQAGGGFQNRGQNRGDRAPQAQAAPQPAPSVQQQAQSSRGDWGQRQGQAAQGNRGGDRQRGWTDAQREAYRGAVLEGRATDQFQNRSTWQTDRNGNRADDRRGPGQWQGRREDDRRGDRDGRDRRDGWQNRGDRSGWQDNRGGTYGRESWRNNGVRDNRAWDRGWRGNNRYDWSSYRSRNRAIFSSGRYYAPYRNYSYRRLSIGFSLGAPFFGSQYLINDPYYYRLPEAYGPYRWVRYYDDVLLVDTYSGEVVDAIYDFFY